MIALYGFACKPMFSENSIYKLFVKIVENQKPNDTRKKVFLRLLLSKIILPIKFNYIFANELDNLT